MSKAMVPHAIGFTLKEGGYWIPVPKAVLVTKSMVNAGLIPDDWFAIFFSTNEIWDRMLGWDLTRDDASRQKTRTYLEIEALAESE